MTEPSLSHLERLIGRILRFGVAMSSGLLTIGLILWLANAGGAIRVLNAGLAVLIAIPITRIVAAFLDSLRRHDRLMGGATAAVLVILTMTIAYSLLAPGA